jgi:hypothetical protein
VREDVLRERVNSLIAQANQPSTLEVQNECYQGTVSVMQALYGSGSAQEDDLRSAIERMSQNSHPTNKTVVWASMAAIRGALTNLKAEIDAGFVGSVRADATGEVLADLIGLARRTLEEKGAGPTHVASVLAAAAFEDTIRRAAMQAGIPQSEKLVELLAALKENGVLRGTEIGVAQSYLSFRNKALHAQWDDVDRPVVESVLAFTEQLILRALK